jgi:hypothetical protein
VVVAVKVVGVEDVGDLDDGVLVDEQGAQDRLLGLDALRREAVDRQLMAPLGLFPRMGTCHPGPDIVGRRTRTYHRLITDFGPRLCGALWSVWRDGT